jgi:hypothetical protein
VEFKPKVIGFPAGQRFGLKAGATLGAVEKAAGNERHTAVRENIFEPRRPMGQWSVGLDAKPNAGKPDDFQLLSQDIAVIDEAPRVVRPHVARRLAPP